MIELNSKTQQDFLNREWVQKILDAGVDMSDAKYRIVHVNGAKDCIATKDWTDEWVLHECCPTYTVSELLYKLRNRYGMYTIFNCYKNLEADNISIIETLASFLIQCHKKDSGIETKDTGGISNK